MEFSETLLKLRHQMGLSQKELAEKLDVAQASINYWEKNQRVPSVEAVQKIADFFGVSVDYLINGENTQQARLKLIPEKYNMLLRKYHCLDEHGKELVNMVLDKEYERCRSTPMSQKYMKLAGQDSESNIEKTIK